MKYLISNLLTVIFFSGCATVKIAENVKMVAFTDKPTTRETKSLGNIEGKDCTWYVWGYAMGTDPSVRTAFINTAEQSEEIIPMMKKKKEGSSGGLSYLRNVAVDPSGFNAWLVSRSCMNVTGLGYQ